jgi:hypothetical protein
MKRPFALVFLLSVLGWSQVYTTTLNSGGSGYTNATASSTGGGCTTQPTYAVTTTAGAVATIVPSYMGTGCTSAPTITFAGGGSGASATASILPATMVILSAVPTINGTSTSPVSGGQYTAYQYLCWLTVPQHRVGFYVGGLTNSVFRMPGTTQTTAAATSLVSGFNSGPTGPNLLLALSYGIMTEWDDFVVQSSSSPIANAEAEMVTRCGVEQTNLTTWNPWGNFGTYYNGTWNTQGYQ